MAADVNPAAPTDAPIVDIRGLRKRFGENEVLKGIDLAVRPGEVAYAMKKFCGLPRSASPSPATARSS